MKLIRMPETQEGWDAMMAAYQARLAAQPLRKRVARKIRWAWERYWRYGIKDAAWAIFNGIGNLIRWAPVIWRDRDDEDHYLFAILEFKLSRMAAYFDRYFVQAGWDKKGNNWVRDVKRMRLCAALCRRIVSDDYEDDGQSQRDRAYLGYLLGKHSCGWWW